MATNEEEINTNEITEGRYGVELWNPFDFHFVSYLKSSIQLYFISSRTSIIARALRHAIVNLLDYTSQQPNEYVENETTIMGTEHHVYHTCHYTIPLTGNEPQSGESNSGGSMEFEIKSLAPSVFYKLREDIGISNQDFRRSFVNRALVDFTNPGKSGSLMFKTHDGLFILKTLREYEARLLMQILPGYHLRFTQYPTILNRYVGLYSLRFPALISSIEIHIVIITSAFSSSLQISEVFDLKGSSIKRQHVGSLSVDKLQNLKDLDFVNLYPYGIRIPSNIYQSLKRVISNDAKALRKLNITDFSLILGIRYVDTSVNNVMQLRPSTGIGALVYLHRNLSLLPSMKQKNRGSSSDVDSDSATISIPYLKPVQMLHENIDKNLIYKNDSITCSSLPVPGIINKSNRRVYLYLAIVDMLQPFDSLKSMERKLNRITSPRHHHEYSVIEPDEYEKRIMKFLFEKVFIDAGDDFPWDITSISKPVANIETRRLRTKLQQLTHQRSRSVEDDKVHPTDIILRF